MLQNSLAWGLSCSLLQEPQAFLPNLRRDSSLVGTPSISPSLTSSSAFHPSQPLPSTLPSLCLPFGTHLWG